MERHLEADGNPYNPYGYPYNHEYVSAECSMADGHRARESRRTAVERPDIEWHPRTWFCHISAPGEGLVPVGGGDHHHVAALPQPVHQRKQRAHHRRVDLQAAPPRSSHRSDRRMKDRVLPWSDAHPAPAQAQPASVRLISAQSASVHACMHACPGEEGGGGIVSTWSEPPSRVLRTGASASSSSRNIIAGAALLACNPMTRAGCPCRSVKHWLGSRP